MFINILRISASNVVKMFLDIIVSIGHAVVIFHLYKPTGSTEMLCLNNHYPDQQERNKINISC